MPEFQLPICPPNPVLEDLLVSLIRAARAPSTRKAYSKDWAICERHCASLGHP